MKKIVLTFGLIGGGVMAVLMFGTLPFMHQIGFNRGLIVGYTTIVLSFMLVFFGIRSYRENVGHGQIGFFRGLGVGVLIMLIICAFYVITWEIIYFTIMPDFVEKYAAFVAEQARASGATQQVIEAQIQEARNLKPLLDNPFTNAALTLIEPLPVGIVITLISAAVLRRKAKDNNADPIKQESLSDSFA